MNVFLDAFFAIDTDNCEVITTEDLKAYMVKNDLEEGFVKKWLSTFDKERRGKITLEQYCQVLGLLPKKARIYKLETESKLQKSKVMQQQGAAPTPQVRLLQRSLPDKLEVITQDMPLDLQCDIAEIAERALQRASAENQRRAAASSKSSYANEEREIANEIKRMLDQKNGRIWHVVVVIGQYWINYSHEPECSFHFKLGRHIFLVWKTPAYP